jgi:hypothetical protein
MPTIETCAHENRRTTFTYRGDIANGITIEFESGDFDIDANTIQSVLNHFSGQQVLGGFSMTEPTAGGVGEFLSRQGNLLTPRHASFLCAALQHEGYIECELNGNAVIVTFNA